jgi:hypothetical protein
MAQSTDTNKCSCSDIADEIRTPFLLLRYHFGMLLGADDFDTQKNYHRGKMWLHNMWLHGTGVVWGFNVQFDKIKGELRVLPGLALDPLGRELHLDTDACLNVAAWFTERRKKEEADTTWFKEEGAGITFSGHVQICFKTCLTRQVPALSEPCEGGGTSTEYSRIFESVEIKFCAGTAPNPPPRPYHLLRILFGLEAPANDDEKEVLTDLTALESLQPDQRAPGFLNLFRKYAAFDEIALRPPEGEKFCIPLANVTDIALMKVGEEYQYVVGKEALIDVTIRPSHVATSTIQELLCRPCCFEELPPAGEGGSPQVVPRSASVDTENDTATFQTTADLEETTVKASQFGITYYFVKEKGWQPAKIKKATLAEDNRTVNIEFTPPANEPEQVRLTANGSGATPLLGANLVEFNNGKTFVYVQKGSSK